MMEPVELLQNVFTTKQFPLVENVPVPPVVAQMLLKTHPDSSSFDPIIAQVAARFAKDQGHLQLVTAEETFNCMAEFSRGMLYTAALFHAHHPEATAKINSFYIDDEVQPTAEVFDSAGIEWVNDKGKYRLYVNPALILCYAIEQRQKSPKRSFRMSKLPGMKFSAQEFVLLTGMEEMLHVYQLDLLAPEKRYRDYHNEDGTLDEKKYAADPVEMEAGDFLLKMAKRLKLGDKFADRAVEGVPRL